MSAEKEQRPQTGIGICIIKNGKVLLGKRKNSHGSACWSFPGGHLEMYESWEHCAEREAFEETGLKIKNIKFIGATNDIFTEEGKHYITIFLRADYDSGIQEVREPEKCDEWMWFRWEDLPAPLFLPIINLISQGYRPEIQ